MAESTRTEFPALEARKGYLEHAYYEAKRQADTQAYEGKPDSATQQWLISIRAELDELTYLLKLVYAQLDERKQISHHALIVVAVINAAIIAAILYLYMRP